MPDKPAIEIIAINYGESRYGRSCGNCNYIKKYILSNVCELHGLETGSKNCCGTWCGDSPKPVEENQAELW
jgi:hypothetical protein